MNPRPTIQNWWIDEDHGALRLTVRWDIPGIHLVRYARGHVTSRDGRPALKHRNQTPTRSLLPDHRGVGWFHMVGTDQQASLGPSSPLLEAAVLMEADLERIAHRWDITVTDELAAIMAEWTVSAPDEHEDSTVVPSPPDDASPGGVTCSE